MPDISLLGAVYPDVPGVTLPIDGGGTATFTDVSDTTAAAADVASGKYFYTAAGVKTQGTASGGGGGGGASNIVTGTFTGTTTGAAMDVTLNYSGSGYPVAVIIYADNTDSTFNDLLQRYAIQQYLLRKYLGNAAPGYTAAGNQDAASVCAYYKNNATNAASYGSSGAATARLYSDEGATSSNASNCVRLRSNKKLSVFIAGTSYGFAANITYNYCVIYSS